MKNSATVLDFFFFSYPSAILQIWLLVYTKTMLCVDCDYCLCYKDVLRVSTVNQCPGVGHYTAFISPNWCAGAGAGRNLQECQLSIPEALPTAHLIKGQIDGPADSSMSIRKEPSGNYIDDRKLSWLNNPIKGQTRMETI